MSQMIFVVMPFSSTPTRDKRDLTEFFESHLKDRIEREPIAGVSFVVKRSDDTFNINEQVIRDLYLADIVIADLSGREANPNVMYELGVRLAVSSKPVILIREDHAENRSIFDIAGFHTFVYSPLQYRLLEEHIVAKIERFTSKTEEYQSPVLSVLEQEPSIVRRIEANRLYNRLTAVSHNVYDLRRAVMPRISGFCRDKVALTFSEEVERFQGQFIEQFQQLAQLDWSTLHLRVRPTPSLVNVIAEPPDPKLIGAEEYKAFTAYLNQFFNDLFAIDSEWSFQQLALFIVEAPLLEDLVDAVRRMLSDNESAVAYGKAQFRKLLQNSNFGWHVAIQHFLNLPDDDAGRLFIIPNAPGVFETKEQLIAVIEDALRSGYSNRQEMYVALERGLRAAGAAGPPLEALLDNFASQLRVDRSALTRLDSV